MNSHSVQNALPSWAKPSAPVFVHLTVTDLCNWKCPFCVIAKADGKHGDYDQLTRVIDALAQARVFEVTVYGGEPLRHPRIREIGQYIAAAGMRPGFVSNGDVVLRGDEIVAAFPQGSVSIHGSEAIHDRLVRSPGAWARSYEFLRSYIEAGGLASVCLTVGTHNSAGFEEFAYSIANELKICSLVINPVIPFEGAGTALSSGQVQDLLRRCVVLEDELNVLGCDLVIGASVPFCVLPAEASHLATICYSGSLFATVNSKGEIAICPERGSPVGNVLEEDIVSIWSRASEHDLMTSGSFADMMCQRCLAYPWCIGGCRSVRNHDGPTTDPRAQGIGAARRNLHAARANVKDTQPDMHTVAPSVVRVAEGVRFRMEPFGMHVLAPNGQVLALDTHGAAVFSNIAEVDGAFGLQIDGSSPQRKEECIEFIVQGISLGVFEEA